MARRAPSGELTEPKDHDPARGDHPPPIEDDIFEEAKFVGKTYSASREWNDWSVSAREDFWSIAQDILGVPDERQTPMPDKYA